MDRFVGMYSKQDILDKLLDNKAPRLLFGRNTYSKAIAKHYSFDGVIDDFSDDDDWENLPILKTADLPQNAIILNCSGGKTQTVKHILDQRDVLNVDYFFFKANVENDELPEIRFGENFTEEYERHRDKFDWLLERLEDPLSKGIFNKLCQFKLSYDLTYLEGFKDLEKQQYFENFLPLKQSEEHFVDIGCFDGFTSLEFAKKFPDYRAITAFEPDPENFMICKKNLRALRNTNCLDIGLSEHMEEAYMTSAGSASSVSDQGDYKVSLRTLDDMSLDRPTFIKMDVEGFENKILAGSTKTIEAHYPTLAIGAYHNPNQLWQVAEQVLNIRDDYALKVRHYTETVYETVLFFLPA